MTKNFNEYNPDQPFEGLTFVGWLKVIFQTRAATIRQCDIVVDTLVRNNDLLNGELQKMTALQIRFTQLVQVQRSALELAKDAAERDGWNYQGRAQYVVDACAAINAAIAAGDQPL